jgi:hypothetical protein
MRYVRANTKVPTPEILAYDLDADNAVGGAWLVMKYVMSFFLLMHPRCPAHVCKIS